LQISQFHVDAFTDKLFSGNPAAVCPLEAWLPEDAMLAIAAENNLSETAFFVSEGDGYRLRWFSPVSEVRLCGHATLASAFVIFRYLRHGLKSVTFHTRSGKLIVAEEERGIVLDFPAIPHRASAEPPQDLIQGLGLTPQIVLETGASALERNYFAVYEREEQVRELRPNMECLAKLHPAGACVTAPGNHADFVSRYFVPSYGVPEDPVTGSTHCTLGPYWSERLSKPVLHARQISTRGGTLLVEPRGERVRITGNAMLYANGTITLRATG